MIYSIGHSTWHIEAFIEALHQTGVDTLMDVRSHPGSAKFPQFNRRTFACSLELANIQYVWEPGLGGWTAEHQLLAEDFAKHGIHIEHYAGAFPKQHISKQTEAPVDRPVWTSVGLRDYSGFQTLPKYHAAVSKLVERGRTQNVAICCQEAVWWRCHRSMIADHLVWLGSDCIHITPRQTKILGMRISLRPHSEAIGNRLKRYEPFVLEAWERSVAQ